jgi:6-phosphogluconolactonase
MSHSVAFAVEGADKAQILAQIYQGPRDPLKYPAQIVQPSSRRLSWFVDALAAGMLREKAH